MLIRIESFLNNQFKDYVQPSQQELNEEFEKILSDNFTFTTA